MTLVPWLSLRRRPRPASACRAPFRPQLEALEDRCVPAVFLVTNNGDADYPTDGSYHGVGSLRQAIIAANLNPGLDTIDFDLPENQLSIEPATPLPTISDAVIIDGASQPGWLGAAAVGLSWTTVNAGGQKVTGGNGLTISADGCTVKYLNIGGFTDGDAIELLSSDNVLTGNFLVDSGLVVGPGTANNRIGEPDVNDGISVEGNVIDGVLLASTSDNILQGNTIKSGLDIRGGSGNRIGGTGTGQGNQIGGGGITLEFGTTENFVQGNDIDSNNSAGVTLFAAPNNTIGGTIPGAGNVITRNGRAGIWLSDTGTTGNVVQGNSIGVYPGAAALDFGNLGPGVLISEGASDNTIGGTVPGAGNVISFNTGTQGPNGGTSPAPGVAIVAAFGANPTGNAILGNSIHDNTGPGIDLGNDGPTPNHPAPSATGPNLFQNFPVLTGATLAPTGLSVSGNLSGCTPDTTFTMQFYGNPGSASPPEGQDYLGSATVTTDVTGNGFFTSVVVNAPPAGDALITATATDPAGNTSEFSAAVSLVTVTQTVSPIPAFLGGNVTYHITVSGSTMDAKLIDTLPPQAVLVSASNSAATLDPTTNSVVLDLGAVNATTSPSVDITVTLTTVDQVTSQTTGLATNIASVTTNPAQGAATTTVSKAGATVPLTPTQAFVAQVYLDVLHRSVEGGQLALNPPAGSPPTWVSMLNDDTNPATRLSRALMVEEIQNSDEYLALVIQSQYQRLLHRAASDDATHTSATEVGGWLNQFKHTAGFTVTVLEADIMGSAEYFGQRGGLSNGGWLMAVYEDVLNRALDAPTPQSGAQYWSGRLVDPTLGVDAPSRRSAVALLILDSLESDQDVVEGLYQQFLHRSADSGGLNAFSYALQNGESPATAQAAIIGSDEYFERL
jgi:hypothetical protein